MPKAIAPTPFTLQIIGHPYCFTLNALYGRERLSQPFIFRCVVSLHHPLCDGKKYIGSQVVFSLGSRQWSGYITDITPQDSDRNIVRYIFIIRPRIALMSDLPRCRIFKNINALDLICNILNEDRVKCYRIKCQRYYACQSSIVQYRESNFQFMSRLLSTNNLFYYFSQENKQQMLIIFDDLADLPGIPDPICESHLIDSRFIQSINDLNYHIKGKSTNSTLSLGKFTTNRMYYLVTHITHTIALTDDRKVPTSDSYHNRFHCQCLKNYQPSPASKLIISGHQYATVKTLFKYDMVGVMFPWDSSQTVVLAKLTHAVAGESYGHQWLPSINEQVVIMFYDGDPHQPYVIGSVALTSQSHDGFYIKQQGSHHNNHRVNKFYNQVRFANFNELACVDFQAIKNLYWQSCYMTQRIRGGHDICTKQGSMITKAQNNHIIIKASESIKLIVGKSTLEITSNTIKVNASKVIIQRSSNATLKAIARVSDLHICPRITAQIPHQGGKILTGALSILINGKPAARVGDLSPCTILVDKVISGALSVFFEGRKAARVNDVTQHGGRITSGSENVFIECDEKTHIKDKTLHKKNSPSSYYIKVK
jgi:uncharacterized protein involved in type VI secretion and phage assembly